MKEPSDRVVMAITQRNGTRTGRVEPLSPAVAPSRSDPPGADVADIARLREIALQAERFTDELDDLHACFAMQHYCQEARPLAALLEQAAAAAQDLAIATKHAAELINRGTGPSGRIHRAK